MVVVSFTVPKHSNCMICLEFVRSALSLGSRGRTMCAASATLKFLHNAGEVEGKYLQDTGLLRGETQREQQHANKVEVNGRYVHSRSASPVCMVSEQRTQVLGGGMPHPSHHT